MSQSASGQEPEQGIPIAPSLTEADAGSGPRQNILSRRVLLLSIQAIINAVLIGVIARLLLGLIDLVTNLAFYGRFSFAASEPAHHSLGLLVILVPVAGGLIIGIMARFGSAAIRGHGIPEAMEQVLVNESRIKPVIMFLKPLSAAISIGTGGPFGAEGPIIATGGAMGSVAGQIMHITANERKIILAAGATAGMAAIFGTPVAAVLLAIELLLFEFSPRSIIPVALSCAAGAAMHLVFFGSEPAFAMMQIPEPTTLALAIYTCLGLVIGVAAAYVSKAVYAVEDLFERLPVHWMWWPAIGAIGVGIVGYFAPLTLGVGYSNITNLLNEQMPLNVMLSLCFLKFLSWVISLGSGTSGGTLAPLLTIGGALGGLLGLLIQAIFPESGISLATCALIGMAAMFAGASRALLTSIVFALETTMQPHGLLPLLGACTTSYFVSFFLMKGSIMTEKIERRGVFAPHSYEPDVLQLVQAREVMTRDVDMLSTDNTVSEARIWVKQYAREAGPALSFIVVDEHNQLAGLLSRAAIFDKSQPDDAPISKLLKPDCPFIYPETQLSVAIDLMDQHQTDLLPVLAHGSKKEVAGLIRHQEVFHAYRKRRHETGSFSSTISVRDEGMRIIRRGRSLLGGSQ